MCIRDRTSLASGTRLLEVEELRACHVDTKSLELLLARLDDYLAHGIGLVRMAVPQQGVFDAIAPTLDRLPSLDFSELVRDVAYLARG